MIKKLLIGLIILCGIVGNIEAGDYSVGTIITYSVHPISPLYGIRGYILIEPYGIAQTGHGNIYHTHAQGSNHSPEILVYYGTNQHIGLKFYRWVPSGRKWIDVLSNTTGTGSAWANAAYDVSIVPNGDGVIATSSVKYITDITIGTETKKAIYFDSVSVFQDFPGTTSGTWRSYARIKNFDTGIMDMKWHYQWNGTLAENYRTASTPGVLWAGILETFNYVEANGTMSSTGTRSAGNYLMDFCTSTGLWGPFDTISHSLRMNDLSLSDPTAITGLTVYNPGASPGAWLAHVP